MEISKEYVAPALDWYTRHVNPIIAKMYLGDREAVRRLTMRAWEALSSPELNDDQRQCSRYRLSYVVWQDKLRLGTNVEAREGFAELAQRLSEPPCGPLSEKMQLRMQLQTAAQADIEGLGELTLEEYNRLRRELPEMLLDTELHHFIASWGFKRKLLEPLEQAMEVLTFSSTGYQSDYAWQRANLMYLLLRHKATRRDVLELLKRIEYPHHWRVIRMTLWDEVVAAGLVDAEVEQALAAKLEALEAMPPAAPGHGESTKRIRKDL